MNDLRTAACAAEKVMLRAAHILDHLGGPNKKAMAQELRESAGAIEHALDATTPGLLEALRGLVAPNHSPETYDAAFKTALAAIAKAEGRS